MSEVERTSGKLVRSVYQDNSIDTFKSAISKRGGFARANRFEIEIEGTDNKDLTLFCESVTLPGRSIITHDRYTSSKGYKMPYGYTDGDVTMVFNVTNDFHQLNFFRNWLNEIIGSGSGSGLVDQNWVNFKKGTNFGDDSYTRLVKIGVISGDPWSIGTDTASEMISGVVLHNAFPLSVSDLELSNANENTIIQVTVQLGYDTWEINR